MTAYAIDRLAEVNFGGLEKYRKALREDRNRRRGGTSQTSRRENDALDRLLDEFREIAKAYFDKAQVWIEQGDKPPKDKAGDYYKVLSRLGDHVMLLSDIVRAPLGAGDELGENRALINLVMDIIATRFDSPTLFLMPSQNFKYIHFHYDPDIAIVGIPPEVLADPSWNMSVLWHEIAGHGIALKRDTGELKTWAEQELATSVWDALYPLYEDSFLNRMVVQGKRVSDDSGKSSYEVRLCQENQDCQQDWLAEFFEDLFGVQSLGGTMVEMMADALIQRQPESLEIGDANHPPANVRLEVALAYMDLVYADISNDSDPQKELFNSSKTRQRLDERYRTEGAGGLEELGLMSFSDELKAAAQAIAVFYRQKVEKGQFFKKDISSKEKTLAQAVCDAYEEYISGAELKDVLERLSGKIDHIEVSPVDIKPRPDGPNQFVQKIKQTPDLDSLLRLELESVDMYRQKGKKPFPANPNPPYPSGITGWPPGSLSQRTWPKR